MEKQLLRKKYLSIRKEILNKEYKSNVIQDRIINSDIYKVSNTIGIYVNLKDEVGTQNIIIASLNLKKIVAVPIVHSDGNMDFYRINRLDDLTSINKFNIKEPEIDLKKIVSPSDIDLFIIPGICFDKNKNRIGFGGGYYDRYLSQNPNSYKIGIAFYEQILLDDFIDNDDNDIKLDEIVTDKILIK